MPEGDPDTSSLINPYTRYNTFEQDTFPVTLYASNKWCADSITKNLIIYDIFGVYIPNAFSPNNDGKNETFYPTGRNITGENYEFTVFNRWGEIIYQTNTPLAAWNGRKHNTLDESQIDVYVWKLLVKNTFTNKKEEYVGTVTLVR
jgi:gliding motility-associated-like protein